MQQEWNVNFHIKDECSLLFSLCHWNDHHFHKTAFQVSAINIRKAHCSLHFDFIAASFCIYAFTAWTTIKWFTYAKSPTSEFRYPAVSIFILLGTWNSKLRKLEGILKQFSNLSCMRTVCWKMSTNLKTQEKKSIFAHRNNLWQKCKKQAPGQTPGPIFFYSTPI